MCAVLREAHERQIEETMDALEDGRSASTRATRTTKRGGTVRKRAEYPWQSELPPRDAPEASGEPERVAEPRPAAGGAQEAQ